MRLGSPLHCLGQPVGVSAGPLFAAARQHCNSSQERRHCLQAPCLHASPGSSNPHLGPGWGSWASCQRPVPRLVSCPWGAAAAPCQHTAAELQPRCAQARPRAPAQLPQRLPLQQPAHLPARDAPPHQRFWACRYGVVLHPQMPSAYCWCPRGRRHCHPHRCGVQTRCVAQQGRLWRLLPSPPHPGASVWPRAAEATDAAGRAQHAAPAHCQMQWSPHQPAAHAGQLQ